MKKSTQYKISALLLLGAVLFGYNQCVTPMGSPKKNSLKFSDKKTSSVTTATSSAAPAAPANTTVTRAVSVEAFRQSVYSITKVRCVNCHGASQTPLHASSDINTAYDAVMNNAKVDFSNPANSRLYLKLKNENHNCWNNCASNASEMLAQITNWKNMTNGTSADLGNTALAANTTRESMTISSALNPDNFSNAGTVTLMTEASSLKAPMVMGTEAGMSFIWAPLFAGTKDLTSTDAGTATLNFTLQASDFYNVYMLVNAPDTSADSVYVKISGSDYKEWTIDATSGFQWREVTNTPQKLQTEFYLTGSKNYQLEIRQNKPGVKIAKVVVTNDLSYDPTKTSRMNQKATITASLSEITGITDAYFDIDVEEFDLYSYKLSNPRIRTSKDLLVKKLKVLVNGSYNPQQSTYLVVNKVVTKADPTLSPYSMVLLKDKGSDVDKLSFSFETIEVVK